MTTPSASAKAQGVGWQRLRNWFSPPRIWAVVVYGDHDAELVPMERLTRHDIVLWGSCRNLTLKQAKRKRDAFNCGASQ